MHIGLHSVHTQCVLAHLCTSVCPSSVCAYLYGVGLVLAQLLHGGCMYNHSLAGRTPGSTSVPMCVRASVCSALNGECVPQLCVHVWGSSKRTETAILGPRVITQTRMWSRAPPWGIHMTLEPGLTIADNATGRSEHACPSWSRQHSTGRGRSMEA